jgi:hypothetical protein
MVIFQRRVLHLCLLYSILLLASCKTHNSKKESMPETKLKLNEDTTALVIIWSSADKEMALKTALSYALNSRLNGWINNVTLLVWGPSVQLLAKDKDIQNVFIYMKQAGVTILVDKKCVEEYELTKEIEVLNLEVKSMGKPFSDFIRQKRTILTF